jgi:hypothetical protein
MTDIEARLRAVPRLRFRGDTQTVNGDWVGPVELFDPDYPALAAVVREMVEREESATLVEQAREIERLLEALEELVGAHSIVWVGQERDRVINEAIAKARAALRPTPGAGNPTTPDPLDTAPEL